MTLKRRIMPWFCLLLAGGLSAGFLVEAEAGVMADSTRVVYLEGQKERTLMVVNTNDYPVLVQVWISHGEESLTPQLALTPMIALPPVFRLQPGALQGLRLMFTGERLPEDRESVFWLNLYEVPPTLSKTPTLTPKVAMAMNTQMKIFYRPKTVSALKNDLLHALSFRLQREGGKSCLSVLNPTAYHASFSSLRLINHDQGLSVTQQHDMMTPPFSTKCYSFAADTTIAIAKAQVRFTLLDDEGQIQEGTASVGASSNPPTE